MLGSRTPAARQRAPLPPLSRAPPLRAGAAHNQNDTAQLTFRPARIDGVTDKVAGSSQILSQTHYIVGSSQVVKLFSSANCNVSNY